MTIVILFDLWLLSDRIHNFNCILDLNYRIGECIERCISRSSHVH
jgi:hypothetical protein